MDANKTEGFSFEKDLVAAQIPLLKYISCFIGIQDAEDVLQKVNCILLERQGQFDASRGTVQAWAVQTAKYEILHYLSDQRRSRVVFSSETVELLSDVLQEPKPEAEDARLVALEECLGKLPAWQHDLITEHHFDQIPLQELGRRLKRTPSSLAVTLYNIRDNLRRCVQGKIIGRRKA